MGVRDSKPAIGAVLALIGAAAANAWLMSVVGATSVWLVTLAASVALAGCIGKAINGRWAGVVVSGTNRISLSRLQMLAWTLLILSALITAGSHNLYAGYDASSLDIALDPHLLIVMGIATTSLVATPAVLSLRSGDGGATILATKDSPAEASWLDIFRSDMADSADLPDLSKIQQFLVTLAVLSGYAVMIGQRFAALTGCMGTNANCRFAQFPPLGEQIVWLIGISHAGYVAYKAATKPTLGSAGAVAAVPSADGAVG